MEGEKKASIYVTNNHICHCRHRLLSALRHLSFVVADGGVHLLLIDVLDLRCGAAQDALLLLLGQRLCYHLDGFGPLVSTGTRQPDDHLNYQQSFCLFLMRVALALTKIFT